MALSPESQLTRRLELQTQLENLLGSRSVYFQPPNNVKMSYPAIVYGLDNQAAEHAGNNPYILTDRYQISVLDADPDSIIPRKVAKLPQTSFVRAFKQNDLNHTIYVLYF